MVWNVRGVFQFPDEDKHDVEDVDWGGDGDGDWSKQGKNDDEENSLTTISILVQKPNQSNKCKENGCREKGGSNNDTPPDWVAVFDKVGPVNQIGDHVKDK